MSFIQLKNFIQRASFDPVIDNNYFARAEENDEDILSTSTAKYILAFYIVGFTLALIIALILLFIYFNTKRWDKKLARRTSKKKKLYKYAKSKIFSIAVSIFFLNLYALILDGFALYTIVKGNVTINERYVNDLPKIVTFVDIAGALAWITCWILGLCSWACHTPTNELNETKRFQNKEYMFLALSTLGPILSLVIHLPYIAIAYLNDASYATSIFIYYTITVFVLFGVLDLTYGTCQGAIINVNNEHPRNQEEGCYAYCPSNEARTRALFTIAIPAFALITLILAGMITALLVVIPISKAFSDVSNRLIGFYQSAIVLIGAYLIYRNFFKKKPSLESAVKNREKFIPTKVIKNDKHWEQLSRDDRVEEFYSRFVDIVANHPIGAGMREEEEEAGQEEEGDEEEEGAGQEEEEGDEGREERNVDEGRDVAVTRERKTEAREGEKGTVMGGGAESSSKASEAKEDGDQNDDETTPLIQIQS